MSARVQQGCMQCVNGIRSERGEECTRARGLPAMREQWHTERGAMSARVQQGCMQCANGIRSEVWSARVREDCLQCANNGIRSEERSACVREDCLQCANGIRSEVWSARVREDCLQCRMGTFFDLQGRSAVKIAKQS